MFWRRKVRISKASYRDLSPVIYLYRVHGLFPIKIQRDDSQSFFMKLSPLYASYSIVLQLVLNVTVYLGIYVDATADYSEAIRIHSKTDLFSIMADIISSNLTMFLFMVFVPSKSMDFFDYVQSINQIDVNLQTKYSKWERWRRLLMCYGWWLVVGGMMTFHYLTLVVLVKQSWLWILKVFFSHYIVAVILILGEYEFQLLGSGLQKRIKGLNENLSQFYEEHQARISGNPPSTVNSIRASKVFVKAYRDKVTPETRINLLMDTYLKLTDAATLQNNVLGLTGMVASALAFWHLVLSMFCLFFEFTEKRPNPTAIAMNLIWSLFGVNRLLLIGEPWRICHQQAETTKSWVCKLHCSKVGVQLRKKILTFQTILGLRQVNFSLGGFVAVDRTFVSSLLAYTLTFVAILLQFRAEE